MISNTKAHIGDFQTPPDLVDAVLHVLEPVLKSATRVLEPTCGSGAFLAGLLDLPNGPREIKAFELQQEHFAAARRLADRSERRIDLRQADIFNVDLSRLEWVEDGPLLVVGNPPWVTNAALGSLGSNVPPKRNLLRLRGIDAMTGSSNFDLTEYIWWKLLTELEGERPTIALLSKTSTARRVLSLAQRLKIPITDARIHRIDAKRWFGASVDACLFTVNVEDGCVRYEVSVYDELNANSPSTTFGFVGDALVADIAAYTESAFVEGASHLTWRQGVKHDLASVMELRRVEDGRYLNGLDEEVDIEPALIYPLLKSSDLHRGLVAGKRSVIVTQRDLADDPRHLRETAPRTWQYLSRHADLFHRRRSSIYRGRPPFAMFGVGPYSFAPFKVAISGFYKEPRFRLIGPVQGRPIMLDDTCYFVAVDDPARGALLCALLNHSETLRFITSTMFWDSKRPITKKLLQRINPLSVLERVGVDAVAPAAMAELQRLPEQTFDLDWTEIASAMVAEL